jgi:sec-independent protein translocase protein TatA
MVGDILQPTHLLLILVVALLVLGPKRLPEVGRSVGKGIRDFKHAVDFTGERPEDVASTEATKPAPEPADRIT